LINPIHSSVDSLIIAK